jgi:hypothetical protein
MLAKTRTLGLALALALGSLGCTGYIRGSATATTPTLVLVDTGVWVIEDYDEPVFYTDGYYWRFRSGIWYRSYAYNEGWVTVSVVPMGLRRIDRPTRYVHYTAAPQAQRRRGPPDHAPAHGVRGTQPGHHREEARGLAPDRGVDANPGRDHRVKPDKGKPDKDQDKEKGQDRDRDRGRDSDSDSERGGPHKR